MCNLSLGIREEGIREGRKIARKEVLEDLFKEGLITEEIMKEYLSKEIEEEE